MVVCLASEGEAAPGLRDSGESGMDTHRLWAWTRRVAGTVRDPQSHLSLLLLQFACGLMSKHAGTAMFPSPGKGASLGKSEQPGSTPLPKAQCPSLSGSSNARDAALAPRAPSFLGSLLRDRGYTAAAMTLELEHLVHIEANADVRMVADGRNVSQTPTDCLDVGGFLSV